MFDAAKSCRTQHRLLSRPIVIALGVAALVILIAETFLDPLFGGIALFGIIAISSVAIVLWLVGHDRRRVFLLAECLVWGAGALILTWNLAFPPRGELLRTTNYTVKPPVVLSETGWRLMNRHSMERGVEYFCYREMVLGESGDLGHMWATVAQVAWGQWWWWNGVTAGTMLVLGMGLGWVRRRIPVEGRGFPVVVDGNLGTTPE